jgi:hypothetical protein
LIEATPCEREKNLPGRVDISSGVVTILPNGLMDLTGLRPFF